MTTYFISRHPGAHDWAAKKGFQAEVVSHFDTDIVKQDDTVLGTLPVHLAAEVCSKGGRYFHLTLNIPAELRGQEMSAELMEELGAELKEFKITAV